jgi:hypothetical protein
MPSWSLKLSAGSFGYVNANVKNANAPLQPPVADKPASSAAPATPTPAPTLGPLLATRPGQRPPTITPGPRLTLAPGVKSATLPPISFTHTS